MLRKSVIITGASSGIGRATALLFARRGYNVVLARHKASVEELEREIEGFGVEVASFFYALEDVESIKAFYKSAFERFEYIDSVVHCAGQALKEKLFIEVRDGEIEEIINTNLKGTMISCREALKFLTAQKHGNIVNVASILGETGGSFEVAYASSKGGIIALTKSLAVEYAPFRIRVNAVAPGFIETKMTSGIVGENREECLGQIPLQRFGQAEDVASLIFFLSSEEASYITGACFDVNGGAIRFD